MDKIEVVWKPFGFLVAAVGLWAILFVAVEMHHDLAYDYRLTIDGESFVSDYCPVVKGNVVNFRSSPEGTHYREFHDLEVSRFKENQE